MNNLLIEFEQNLAESLNEASQESALDLMKRVEEFAIKLDLLVKDYEINLPTILIDGVLLHNINHRAAMHFRFAEKLSRIAGEKP